MSIRGKKTLVYHFLKAVERYMQGNDNAFDTLLSPHFVDRVLTSGQEGIFITLQVIRESFSEIHIELNDLVIADDTVVVHLTFDLLHTKTFMNIPPTYQHIRFRHVSALRIANGMVIERLWCLSDALTMWKQLGVFTFAPIEISS